MRFLSFGDPKPGNAQVHAELERHPATSIANNGDFVTVLPPDDGIAWTLEFLLGLLAIQGQLLWINEPGRQLQLEDGTLLAGVQTSIGFDTLLDYTLRALASQPIPVIIFHQINVYRERIRFRCPTGGFPVSAPLWLYLLGLTVPEFFGNDFWGIDYFGNDFWG